MRVLLTGVTGSLGRRLVPQLRERGDEVLGVSRNREQAAALLSLPKARILEGDPTFPGDWQGAVSGADAVVHLACAGLAEDAASQEGLDSLRERRLDGIFQVVDAIEKSAQKPRTLLVVSSLLASVKESSSDPIVELYQACEAQAEKAREFGVRVVFLRLGVLLDDRCTAIEALAGSEPSDLPVHYIHASDAAAMIAWILANESVSGAIACCARSPITTRSIQGLLERVQPRRPSGEIVSVLKGMPGAITTSSFVCQYDAFDQAFADVDVRTKQAPSSVQEPRVQHGEQPYVVLPCEGFLFDGMSPHVNAERAVAVLEQAGISVMLATSSGGKVPIDMARRMGVKSPVIAADGSVLLNPLLGEAIRTESLRADRVSAIATAIRTEEPRVVIIVERGIRVGSETEGVPPEPMRQLTSIDEVLDTQTLFGRPATRLLIHAPARRLTRALEVIRSSWWREQLVGIVEYGPDVVSITAPTADRGVALQRAETVLGKRRGTTMVVAATERDAGLLECAGLGLALPTLARRFARTANKVLVTSDPVEVAEAIVRTHLGRVVRAVSDGG